MKIVITDFALRELKSIHSYYKKQVSNEVADKLINKILDSIDVLEIASLSGTPEQNLKSLGLNHRYIIAGNYKIIFRTTDKMLYVTDVFDCRQNPQKISERSK